MVDLMCQVDHTKGCRVPSTLFLDMPAWVFLKRISAFDLVDCVKKFTLSNIGWHHSITWDMNGAKKSKTGKFSLSWAYPSSLAFRHRSSWILGFLKLLYLTPVTQFPGLLLQTEFIPRAFLVFQLLFSLKNSHILKTVVCVNMIRFIF